MEFINIFQNYTRVTLLKLLRLIFVISILSSLSFQNILAQQACPIYTSIETEPTFKVRTANIYDQALPLITHSWDSLNNITTSNDKYARVSLGRFHRAGIIKGNSLNFKLPPEAKISGIELIVEGRSTGEGKVRDISVQLLDGQGEANGTSLGETAGSKAWLKGETDHVWSYGGENETWGLDLTAEMLNDPDFGYQLQIRNSLRDDIEVLIDHISVKVYYEPLYSICDHTCVVFYVDSLEGPYTYNWDLPPGFELLSYSERSGIINIGVSYATFGTYEICVETLTYGDVTGQCCRRFNYENCINATIGDQVWNDINKNAIFDNEDEPIEGVTIELYDGSGILQSTVLSDQNGNYLFDGLAIGDYYVKVDPPQGFTTVFPNIGNENNDSDITGSFGRYTSDLIIIEEEVNIENIDIGLSQSIFIGNQVWEDINGDGIKQITEGGLIDVTISVVSNLGPEFTGVTNAEGKYIMGPYPLGEYEVVFTPQEGFLGTTRDAGMDDEIDSDIDSSGSTGFASFDVPGFIDDIDAGFYKEAVIGDFIWEDINNNGIQDEDETGIAGVVINLIKDEEAVQTTTSDENGFYQFIAAPGVYRLELDVPGLLLPTLSMIGNPDLDSDLIALDGVFTTNDIILLSGDGRLDIDFGLYEAPSTIGGFAWLDLDSDGQLGADEQLLANVSVDLYEESGILVASSLTDTDGSYIFEMLASGNYYLVFGVDDDRLYTIANTGDDASDSDVTSSIVEGSTDIINLEPDVDLLSIYVGHTEKADIGDLVWLDSNRNGLFDAGEFGVPVVPVLLINSDGEAIEVTTTGINGMYLFENIDSGTYTVEFEIGGELNFTEADQGPNDDIDSDVIAISIGEDILVGATDPFVVNANDVIVNIDAGVLLPLGGIRGQVFLDADKNGDSEGEELIAGVIVNLLDDQQMVVSTTTTGASGEYEFNDLTAGTYSVMFETTSRFNFTTANSTSDDIDSDVTELFGLGTTDNIEVTDGMQVENVDAGLIDGISDISGVVWEDKNGDGIRTIDEALLSSVVVVLTDSETDLVIAETTTSEDGIYTFEDVEAGSYYIVFTTDLIPTIADQGTDDTKDSDITEINGTGSTGVFDHDYFNDITDIDAGFYELATVGDFLWEDLNENGLQDENEPGLAGVTITLVLDGVTILTRSTNESGFYQFQVPPGEYIIELGKEGFIPTIVGAGGDSTLDSDFQITGDRFLTESINLMSGEQNIDIDGGFIPAFGNLSGKVFLDENENGINENEINLEGIIISLFDENQVLRQNTLSGSDGTYMFSNLQPATYYVMFNISERYVFTIPSIGTSDTDSDVTEEVTLGSTALITVENGDNIENIDAGLIDGISSICGLAWIDADGDGIRIDEEQLLPNVAVKLYTVLGELIDSTATDSVGNYCLTEIDSGQYYIIFAPAEDDYIITKFDQGSNDTIDSDITSAFLPGSTTTIITEYFTDIENIDAGYFKYATIGDQVWIDMNENNTKDIDENALDGVTVNLLDTDGLIVNSSVTSPGGGLDSGYYQLDGISPGEYRLQFILPDFYDFVDGDIGPDSNDSDVLTIDGDIGETDLFILASGDVNNTYDAGVFFNKAFTAVLAGSVWSDSNSDGLSIGELVLDGRQVSLFDENGVLISSMVTDSDGDYRFEMLAEGRYYIEVDLADGQVATVPNVGNDDDVDSEFTDSEGPGTSGLIDLENEQQELQFDLGVVNSLTVGDLVWEDLNVNGQYDIGEVGVEGVTVIIESTSGEYIDSTITDESGTYQFVDLPSFTYKLTFRALESTSFTVQQIGASETDSDVDESGCTEELDFTAGGIIEDIDAGLLYDASIQGLAWVDFNANGQRNNLEPGFNDILVSLYKETGELVNSITTGSAALEDGSYIFSEVVPGSYYIEFGVPTEYSITNPDIGNDDTDSDITGSQSLGSTDIFMVESREDLSGIYGGLFLPADLGDRVFLDTNMDGIQDDDEGGVEGVEVILYRSFGLPVDTVVTDEEGFYLFENLKQGLYYIEFTVPESFVISPVDVGNDEDKDSDADGSGTTPLISLAHGASLLSIDMGLFMESLSLRSIAWEDENADGIRQMSEPRLRDIRVELMDEQGEVIDSTWTNHRGKYAFQQLDSGSYFIHIETSNIDYILTQPNNGDDMNDSDILLSGNSEMFTVEETLSVPNIDAGLLSPSMLAIEIWEEKIIDGMYGADEEPLVGIMAELVNEDGVVQNMQMSAEGGTENVVFEKVRPGNYFVRYSNDQDYIGSVNLDEEITNPNNSDILEQGNYFASPMFEVGIDQVIDYIDAGFYIDTENKDNVAPTQINLEDESLEFTIGPNPAMYFIEISDKTKSTDKLFNIRLVDREGKVSFNTNIASPQNFKVPLDELKSGTYYILISDDKSTVTKKILKITP